MIGYLEGRLLKIEEDRVLLLAGPVGYEVLCPAFVMARLAGYSQGDEASFFIYHHQTERQPKPVLIGFTREVEREFFQQFITVEDIGPLKAVKAMTAEPGEVARAIEERDVGALKKMKGIGDRTARKIIASLEGKVGKYALIPREKKAVRPGTEDIAQKVLEVLVEQLGHKTAEARQLIAAALERNSAIATPEDLFEEVYRGQAGGDKGGS